MAVLVLRPRTNFLPDMARRAMSVQAFWIVMLFGLLIIAGLMLQIARYSGKWIPYATVLVVLVAVSVAGVAALFVWLFISRASTRWTLLTDRLVLSRLGARTLDVPRQEIAEARLESISLPQTGLVDPIYLFTDPSGELLFWTVGSQWPPDEMRRLCSTLGIDLVDSASVVHPFSTMPYDRRY